MKPDCQQILTQFASFSVEELSDSEAATLLHHMEECEPCKGQWLLFEKSLTVVTQSGPRDEDVEQHRSQQMWLVCMEHARQKAGISPSEAVSALKPAQKSPVHHAKEEAHASNARVSHASGDMDEDNSPGNSVLTVSRAGLMLVGGALLLLTSSNCLAAQTARAHKPQPALVSSAPMIDYTATLNFKSSAQITPNLVVTPATNSVEARLFESR